MEPDNFGLGLRNSANLPFGRIKNPMFNFESAILLADWNGFKNYKITMETGQD